MTTAAATGKHVLNKPDEWAKESLQGYLTANARDLIALADYPNVVVRHDYNVSSDSRRHRRRVALISGGGSGHEPAHLGFVGAGMLTACVCGDLFASPSVASILAAIRFVAAPTATATAGVLLIVKNYTGDRLNFGLAAQRARCEGIPVEWVLVDDDVALLADETTEDSQNDNSVGRRGLCGTLFVHKLAGALAEQDKSLDEIKSILDSILNRCKNLRTIGVSLSGSVVLPGRRSTMVDTSGASLDLIEVGLGIHGESGRRRMRMEKSADLVKYLLDDYLFKQHQQQQLNTQDMCLMINNLGGLSNLEMYVLVNDCVKYINQQKLGKIRRLYVGTLMTSLNMNGFSLTVLHLTETEQSQLIIDLLDQPTTAPAWPKTCGLDVEEFVYTQTEPTTTHGLLAVDNNSYHGFQTKQQADALEFVLKTISTDVMSSRQLLNELDSGCGDGDCGDSLYKVAQSILAKIETNNEKEDSFLFKYPHQDTGSKPEYRNRSGSLELTKIMNMHSEGMPECFTI